MDSTSHNIRFLGTFKPVLDPKNRVTVPAMWRKRELAGLMSLYDESSGFLWLMEYDEIVRMAEELANKPGVDEEDAHLFREHVYANAAECELDAQGRVVLPGEFVARLGPSKDERELTMVVRGARILVGPTAQIAPREENAKDGFNRVKGKVRL